MYWNPTVAVTLHSVTGWIVTLDVLKCVKNAASVPMDIVE